MTPTSELRFVDRADVYKGDERAGILVRTTAGAAFHYDPLYLQADLPPIATSLLLKEASVQSTGLPPYFANLLPEGVRLLGLKDRTRTSLDDEFTLLLAVGRDCVGDVTVVPEGENVTIPPAAPEEFDVEALFERARAAEDPAALAGVQEKVSSQMLTLPIVGKRGPGILKFNPPGLPNLVRNEHFFLAMANDCGLPAAKATIVTDAKGREALYVERFDRRREGDRWVRIAQEDGCQLCQTYPGAKYRLTVRQLAEAFRQYAGAPNVALQNLLTQLAYAYLMGNGDLHAKNVSLGMTNLGWMPTPAYDLVSTLAYPKLDRRMALKMDGRDDRFRRGHFREFFLRHGLPVKATDRVIDRLLAKTERWIGRLGEIGYDAETTERMAREMVERRTLLGE